MATEQQLITIMSTASHIHIRVQCHLHLSTSPLPSLLSLLPCLPPLTLRASTLVVFSTFIGERRAVLVEVEVEVREEVGEGRGI